MANLSSNKFPNFTFFGKKAVWIAGCTVVCCISCKYVYIRWKNTEEKRAEEKVREKTKTDKREEQISQIKSSLVPENFSKYGEIIGFTLKKLRKKLYRRELLAEDEVQAFIWKSIQVCDEFDCAVEFISGALDKGRELDKMSMVKGPLHGVPFCVSENIGISGVDCEVKTDDAVIIQCLEKLGAIPFCRSWSKSSNLNRLLNPLNKNLNVVGGDVACLVGAGGAQFGVVITGEPSFVSIQAHLCGLSTLITTSLRLSRRGCFNIQGKDSDDKTIVPAILSKSAEDQVMILQALLENNLQTKSDSCAVPLSWNSQVFESKQKFRIGYISGFPSFPPIGDSQFVIGRVKSFLESAGHVSCDVPFDPTDFLDSSSSQDCNREEGGVLEKVINLIKFEYTKKSRSDVTKPDRPNKEDLIHSFLDKMNHQKIDVVISLVLPFPGICVEDVNLVDEGIMAHTLMWNSLNFPVGVVKFWSESGIHLKSSLDLLDKSGKLVWKQKLLKESVNCVGMPIGVQVVGRPFQEELVLKIMVELDDINK